MNTTTNQAAILRSTLEKVLRQNECDMLLTGEEIRAARKLIEVTERAAIQPAGDGWHGSIRQIICDLPIPYEKEARRQGFVDCKMAILDAIKATTPVCTPVQAPDADENAPWLTLAHTICADAGVPCGHITDRLKALREILAAPAVQAAPAFDAMQPCSPYLTMCPRCKNPHNACDQMMAVQAAPMEQAPDAEWLPTSAAINALPERVRAYIHGLEAKCDPAGDIAQNTLLKDQCHGLQIMYRKAADAVIEVIDCFQVAEIEGLTEALAETSDARLKDLVERRLMHAYFATKGSLPPAVQAAPVGKYPAVSKDQARNNQLDIEIAWEAMKSAGLDDPWPRNMSHRINVALAEVDKARAARAPSPPEAKQDASALPSVGDDAEFVRLAIEWEKTKTNSAEAVDTWFALIAYIDARSPVAAPRPDVSARDAAIVACADLMFNWAGLNDPDQQRKCRARMMAMKSAAPEGAEPSADTARLNFVLDNSAFICTVPASKNHGAAYQLMTQDEDEDYHVISGEGVMYRTKREAIDVAMQAQVGEVMK